MAEEEQQLPIIGGGDNAVDEKESSEASEPTQPPADSNLEDNAMDDEKQDGEAHEPSQPPPSSSSPEDEPEPDPTPRDPREDAILEACRRRDIAELQLHAESPGGFLTDELRQQAWPVLLGMPIIPAELNPDLTWGPSWQKLPRHKDEDQVQLDVDRAFVYYPDYPNVHERNASKINLSNLIVSVLRRHPFLHYFQGYHDIAQVFLLVLPPSLRSHAVARLSLLRIRDFMLPNLSAAISQLRLIPSILAAADPKLAAHLAHTEPFFALSGTLTMYAHDITSQNEITRLFDVLLAREPVFSVYMFVQIVRARRAELFATDPPDPDMLHSILSKLPQPLHLDALIAGTAALFRQHPPETLGVAWDAGISAHSVLKTARSTREAAGQSEAVGAFYFEQHLLELARAERKARVLKVLWAYRRPARAVGIAVLVGVLAYWMRRSSLPFPSVVAGPAHAAGRMLAAAWARFSGRVV